MGFLGIIVSGKGAGVNLSSPYAPQGLEYLRYEILSAYDFQNCFLIFPEIG